MSPWGHGETLADIHIPLDSTSMNPETIHPVRIREDHGLIIAPSHQTLKRFWTDLYKA